MEVKTLKHLKSEEGQGVLKATKLAVKMFDEILGFDAKVEAQRQIIRDLMVQQNAAVEAKLTGQKTDGDVADLTKAVRREHNRLDRLLNGKEKMVAECQLRIDEAKNTLGELGSKLTNLEAGNSSDDDEENL
jgi:hypothetical protein